MNTKHCIACYEDIHIKALKCPHCRQIQTKAANLQNKPAFHYIALATMGVLMIMLIYWIIALSIEEPLEPMFEIGEANLHVSVTDAGLNIRCIAEINNPTVRRWDEFTLQAAFSNSAGAIIDVLHAEPTLTVYPLFSFKGIVSGVGSASEKEYDSCLLSVINADSF